jgi:hypothetical protein
MHLWEPTQSLGIQILTIKLLLAISILFVFLGHPVDLSHYYVNNSLIQLSITAKSLLNHLYLCTLMRHTLVFYSV